MPTYREDLHLGHHVALVGTDDISNGAITEPKLADDSVSTRALQDKSVTEPKLDDESVSERTIQEGAVTEPKLDDESVSHRTIQPEAVEGNNIKPGSIQSKHLAPDSVGTANIKDKAVTPQKLSGDVPDAVVKPITDPLDKKYQTITKQLDDKYGSITKELYDMIASLQVGGIALSGQFGDRTDIGIHQKALTKAFGKFWQEMETITGKTYMDFTFTVEPLSVYSESPATFNVIADCSDSISDFDNIRIYVDDVQVAESSDVEIFNTTIEVDHTATVKAVGTILGKVINKQQAVIKELPFLMGSGQTYQDAMIPENLKELDGTLEGDYDCTVSSDGDYIFIIIPISRKDEFRRADMNGYEIPLEKTEMQDYVVYKSYNTYHAGTYNIDININS